MIATSDTWKQLFNSGAKQEYKLVLNNTVEVFIDKSVTITLQEDLFSVGTFSIGGLVAQKLSFELRNDVDVPRMCKIDFYIRYVSRDLTTVSEWLKKGVYWVNSRSRGSTRTLYEALDRASFTDSFIQQDFMDSISAFPANTRYVANLIAQHYGITIVNPEAIFNADAVEYINEMTIRDVLAQIAALSGGNWIFNNEGNLKLVVITRDLWYNVANLNAYPAKDYKAHGNTGRFSRVLMYYADEKAIEYGSEEGITLEVNALWATYASAQYVHSIINGIIYSSSESTGVFIDPAQELGDLVTVPQKKMTDSAALQLGEIQLGDSLANGAYQLTKPTLLPDVGQKQFIGSVSWRFTGTTVADISAPNNFQTENEIPYVGALQRQLRRRVTLGDNYNGVHIGRESGIEIFLSPTGTEEYAIAKAMFNAQQLEFSKRNEDGSWTKSIFFDPIEQEYRFEGLLSVKQPDGTFITTIEGDLIATQSAIFQKNITVGDTIFIGYNKDPITGIGGTPVSVGSGQYGYTNAPGTSTTVARSNHVHGYQFESGNSITAVGVTTSTPSNLTGSSAYPARADHRHYLRYATGSYVYSVSLTGTTTFLTSVSLQPTSEQHGHTFSGQSHTHTLNITRAYGRIAATGIHTHTYYDARNGQNNTTAQTSTANGDTGIGDIVQDVSIQGATTSGTINNAYTTTYYLNTGTGSVGINAPTTSAIANIYS